MPQIRTVEGEQALLELSLRLLLPACLLACPLPLPSPGVSSPALPGTPACMVLIVYLRCCLCSANSYLGEEDVCAQACAGPRAVSAPAWYATSSHGQTASQLGSWVGAAARLCTLLMQRADFSVRALHSSHPMRMLPPSSHVCCRKERAEQRAQVNSQVDTMY